jgi:hypothetical protein
VSSKFILAKAGRQCRSADAEKKNRHHNAAAVPPVTSRPAGTDADHAVRCRHSPPLDVAPERALPGSSDRLCLDSDHRRKADKMKSGDPADCQDTPLPLPGRRRGYFDPWTGGFGEQLQSYPDVSIAAPTGIANPRSADQLRYRAHGSDRGTHFQ